MLTKISFYPVTMNIRTCLALFFFGFASGLPLSLSVSTLSAWYTQDGVSLMGIGMLSLIGQPYVYKFLWAPLMDRYIPPFLGRRRGWILITQIGIIAALLSMSVLSPAHNPLLLAGMATLVAFSSASQDISFSAYLVDVSDAKTRGINAAIQNAGYRIATIFSGALALVLAEAVGWHITYQLMALLMLVGIITCFWAPEPLYENTSPHTLKQAVVQPFVTFFKRFTVRSTLWLLLVLILYKMGDAFFLSFNTTFLLRDLHFTLIEVGLANKLMSIVAAIVGGLLGGWIMIRIDLFKALVIFGILQALSNLVYMALALIGHNLGFMMFSIFTEQFCSALGSVAFTALLMSLCDLRYSATQYALLSALVSISRVYVGPAAALLIEHIGWSWFYFFTFLISLPGVALLFVIRKQITSSQLSTPHPTQSPHPS